MECRIFLFPVFFCKNELIPVKFLFYSYGIAGFQGAFAWLCEMELIAMELISVVSSDDLLFYFGSKNQ